MDKLGRGINDALNQKVSQGAIPDSLREIEYQIERLEGYTRDIMSLLVLPKPVKCDSADGNININDSTLAGQMRGARNRTAIIADDLEAIRGILSEQLGQNLKLV